MTFTIRIGESLESCARRHGIKVVIPGVLESTYLSDSLFIAWKQAHRELAQEKCEHWDGLNMLPTHPRYGKLV